MINVDNVPRDLSVEQVYKYVANAAGGIGLAKGGTCTAMASAEFTFPVPEPEPTASPGPETCGLPPTTPSPTEGGTTTV